MLRLHVGSGTVFLTDGWVNVDATGPKTHLATDRPDLVELYKTDEAHYYARHQKSLADFSATPKPTEYVCDKFGTWERLPAGIGEVDEILARQSFEHLSLSEARRALDEVDRVMKSGGILRLDVPDHDAALDKYAETKDPFYKRHALGPRNSEYGHHIMGYNREQLKTLVEEFGFIFEAEEPNIHLYPAFCLRFRKPGVRIPAEYALSEVTFDPSWRVLDLGPGLHELTRADVYADIDASNLQRLRATGKPAVHCDLSKPLPFKDKEFDYVFCSHVLEHLPNPVQAAEEISRIAERGCVIVPSIFKEFLFGWEEGDHLWGAHPRRHTQDPLILESLNYELRSQLADSNYSATMCRLFRTGPNRLDHDARLLRKWYYKREPFLDVILHWENKFEVAIFR